MGERIRFFFDYKSPFSFLAFRPSVHIEKNFNVEIEWLPFSFNMKEGFGTPEERNEYQTVKLKYWYKDARRFANKQGLTLLGPQRAFDSTHAHIAGLYVQTISHEKFISFTQQVFELFFKRKLVLDDKEEIKQLLAAEGICTDSLEDFYPSGEKKLKEIEKLAQSIGVFGVPSWAFDDGEIFFGQDRIQLVHEKLVEKNLANEEHYAHRKEELEKELQIVNSKL